MGKKAQAMAEVLTMQFQRDEPLMNTVSIKDEFLMWLSGWEHPEANEAGSWEESIQVYDIDPSEQDAEAGMRLRLALRLSTTGNRYLISIMECLDPASRGNYILTTHANWKEDERQLQESLEVNYRGQFADDLRAHHCVWAQNFHEGELGSALNAASAAILGRELTSGTISHSQGTPIDPPPSTPVSFPDDDS